MKDLVVRILNSINNAIALIYKDTCRAFVHKELIKQGFSHAPGVVASITHPEDYCYYSLSCICLGDYDNKVILDENSFSIVAHNHCQLTLSFPYELLDMTEEQIIMWVTQKEVEELKKKYATSTCITQREENTMQGIETSLYKDGVSNYIFKHPYSYERFEVSLNTDTHQLKTCIDNIIENKGSIEDDIYDPYIVLKDIQESNNEILKYIKYLRAQIIELSK